MARITLRPMPAWLVSMLVAIIAAVGLQIASPYCALAEEQSFCLGKVVNAGTDTGYSESNEISEDDPHFGWSLGQFSVSGFTNAKNEDGAFTFLKTNGDTVRLDFRLDQDIDRLNDNDDLSIADDTNGYDEQFGIAKSDPGFGRGTLIVRKTDYQNAQSEPQVYNDYLSGVAVGANTEVDLFEEGDYEVALDYEVKDDPRQVPVVGWSVLPTYHDYTIRFNFSVRNGNTMVFLFDSATGAELTNSSTTKNGFTIDMARSRYLNVNVKREVLASDGIDLVEDTRYNGPAKDGQQYTEPGIYTITATNPSTGQSTEKKIYVGEDPVLAAFASTGYSVGEIQNMVDQGAQISEDGAITWPTSATTETASGRTVANDGPDGQDGSSAEETAADGQAGNSGVPSIALAISAVVVATAVVLVARGKGKHRRERYETRDGKGGAER